MEGRFNVHIHTYGDLAQLRRAVETIPEDIRVHVLDGRYEDFRGEMDLTPGTREYCEATANLVYHAPEAERLPFGEPGKEALRSSQYEKAKWANYEVLPADEWTLRMDTDERLVHLERSIFEDLEHQRRYRPRIEIDDGRVVSRPRIWIPKYWTVWIDDCIIPRDKVARDTPLEHLRNLWYHNRGERTVDLPVEQIEILNEGMSRPKEYQQRRLEHLRVMGRDARANQLEVAIRDDP